MLRRRVDLRTVLALYWYRCGWPIRNSGDTRVNRGSWFLIAVLAGKRSASMEGHCSPDLRKADCGI